jgi:hypothetical protein
VGDGGGGGQGGGGDRRKPGGGVHLPVYPNDGGRKTITNQTETKSLSTERKKGTQILTKFKRKKDYFLGKFIFVSKNAWLSAYFPLLSLNL